MSKIQDTDLLLLNQGGRDYKITAERYKESINDPTLKIEGLMLVNRSGVDYKKQNDAVLDDSQETDLILINRGGVDYKTTAAELREYVNYEPTLPWDDWDGPIYHVKLNHPVEKLQLRMALKHYKPDGTDEQTTNTIVRGDERVILCYKDFAPFALNGLVTWDFGELTDITPNTTLADLFKDQREFNGKLGGNWDTKGMKNMRDVFLNAYAFNQDISGWDMSSVTDVSLMFCNARAFNQDLSQWCVSGITNEDHRIDWDKGADAWTKPKPVWGTCP